MKIGLVRRGYSATGGAEAYLLRLAQALATAGHQLVLFSDVPWPDSAFEEGHIPITRAVLENARSPLRFADALRTVAPRHACDRILSLERVWQCDVFRAGDGVHAAWLDRRAAFEPAWKSLLRRLNPKHRAILRLERALLTGGARRIIANSAMVKNEIIQRFRYPADRIHVIYNGAPPFHIPPGTRALVRRELGFSDQDYLAIFVGSGWDRKGLRFAIEATLRVPQAHLLIAGKGRPPHPFRSSLTPARALAPALPNTPSPASPPDLSRHRSGTDRIHFLGPRSDIPRLLAAADVFILPTIYDPFSNATLEALAAGLPIITTRANGCAEILDPTTDGTPIDTPSNVEALTAALQTWSSPTHRTATLPSRLSKATTFTIDQNLHQTLSVLESPSS